MNLPRIFFFNRVLLSLLLFFVRIICKMTKTSHNDSAETDQLIKRTKDLKLDSVRFSIVNMSLRLQLCGEK